MAGLLLALGPGHGMSSWVSGAAWLIGGGTDVLLIGAGVLWARGCRAPAGPPFWGVTTVCAFGLTAALIKAVTNTYCHGLAAVSPAGS
ncbi:hypothetical protein [Streptomyces sp. NPDC021356]|uniref:hypothetical protein n=1 Tax=Streptomyces sp. NPDC021356 TaxID=3154900 RepID=UPI0033CF6BF2